MCSSLCLPPSLSPGPAHSCFTVQRVLKTSHSRGRCSSQCRSADFTKHRPDLELGVEVLHQVAALLGAAPSKLHQSGVHLYSAEYSSADTAQQYSTDPASSLLLAASPQQWVELCSGGLLADQAEQVGESGLARQTWRGCRRDKCQTLHSSVTKPLSLEIVPLGHLLYPDLAQARLALQPKPAISQHVIQKVSALFTDTPAGCDPPSPAGLNSNAQ